MSDEKRFAREGMIWVCGACGKQARDRYGMEGFHSYGWDESCMLNAVLCDDPQGPNGWQAATPTFVHNGNDGGDGA